MRAPRVLAVMLVAAACALAGCSSKKPSSSPSDANQPAAPATTAAASTGRPVSADPFCNSMRAYNDRFGRINPGALSDPQQFRTLMQDAANAIKDATNAAPTSLKADVDLMSQAVQNLMQAFQQVNYDVTRLPIAAFTALQAPEFVSAGQRIDAYARQNCA